MVARVILLALAAAITCTGVAFCGVALFLLLSDNMRPAAAAGLTALIFFLIVGAGVAIYIVAGHRAHAATPSLAVASGKAAPDDTLVPALTQLAKDHPFLAVGCAAALGVADALNKRAR